MNKRSIFYNKNDSLDIEISNWKRQHDEISLTLRRCLMTTLAFSLFSFVILSMSDVHIFKQTPINVSILGSGLPYHGFLFTGPFILVGLFSYIHVFLGRQSQLVTPKNCVPLPFIFNLESTASKGMSSFLFYLLVPSIQFAFFWKSLPTIMAKVSLFVFTITSVFSIFFYFKNKRKLNSVLRKKVAPFPIIAILLSSLITVINLIPEHKLRFQRVLVLNYADLSNKELSSSDFRHTSLRNAKILNSNLSSSKLQGVEFSGAILRNTKFNNANFNCRSNSEYKDSDGNFLSHRELLLFCGLLIHVDLSGASFRRADLSGANISSSKLIKTDFLNAILIRTNLSNSDLSEANFSRSNLTNAKLKNTNINNTNFLDANITGVTGITCEDLVKSKNWESAIRDEKLACGEEIPKLSRD